jgi:N-acetylmuramoyl-L-alanine amidase
MRNQLHVRDCTSPVRLAYFYGALHGRLPGQSNLSGMMGRPLLNSLRAGLIGLSWSFLATIASGQSKTVVIDAGHGGYDRGGVPGQRISEKDKTLDVAQRLQRILAGNGYRTIMTRNTDDFISLGQRVAVANANRNAIFVSIHFNCATRAGANGIETYYYRSDSSSLASSIHRNVVSGAPSENRGIRRRGFYVLRRTAIPSVLVECGFLTNPTEGSLAQTTDYRQKLAEKIARGVRREPAGDVRPLTDSLRSYSLGNDFVRVPPESSSRSGKRHSSKKKKKRSTDSSSFKRETRIASSED